MEGILRGYNGCHPFVAGQAVVWGQSGLGPHAKDERALHPQHRAV